MGRPLAKPQQNLKHLPNQIILTNPKHAAQTLQAFRVLQGWTQTDIADALATNQSSISEWENNQFEPSIGNFMTWAATLGYQLTLRKFDDPEDGDDAAT